MTDKPVILFPVGFRSDAVLTEPIRKEMKKQGKVTLIEVALQPGCFGTSYFETEKMIRIADPDFALVNADRVEMAGAAAALFHHGIPFGHIYSGTRNNIGTTDDVDRHVMTLWSTIQFCESKKAAETAGLLRHAAGLDTSRIYTVGITHLDGVKFQSCQIPKRPYDLVVYNPPATHFGKHQQSDIILSELEEIDRICVTSGNNVAILNPAPDKGHEQILRFIAEKQNMGWVVIPSLPRQQFIYLLMTCNRLITNSSIEYYEAPTFLGKQNICHIGMRNLGRDTGPFKPGATDRIIDITEKYLCSLMNG